MVVSNCHVHHFEGVCENIKTPSQGSSVRSMRCMLCFEYLCVNDIKSANQLVGNRHKMSVIEIVRFRTSRGNEK